MFKCVLHTVSMWFRRNDILKDTESSFNFGNLLGNIPFSDTQAFYELVKLSIIRVINIAKDVFHMNTLY